MPMSTGFLSPSAGGTPDEVERRKKVAEALFLRGTESTPVGHPLGAVARALSGLVGGYMSGEADREEKAGQAGFMKDFMGALQNQQQGASAPMAAPSPGPVAPPQMPQGPTGPIVSDKPLNGAGVIQGNLSQSDVSFVPPGGGGAVNMPRSAPPQVPQQAPVMPAAAGGIPPGTDKVLAALSNPWGGKFGQGMAMAIAPTLLKPRDQWVPTQAPDGSPAQKNLATGEMKPFGDNKDLAVIQDMQANPGKYGFKGTNDPSFLETVRKRAGGQATSVSVNNVAEPLLEGVGKQLVDQRKAATTAAYETIPSIHEARKALDQGASTGLFAGGKLVLQKAAGLFGLDASAATNTETFRAAAGNQVLAHAKALGANPSNTDREYIQGVIGGNIALEEGTMRRLMDMQEKWARASIQRHNRDADKFLTGPDADRYRAIAPVMKVDEPGQYEKPAPSTAAPDRNAIEQEMRRRNLLQQ